MMDEAAVRFSRSAADGEAILPRPAAEAAENASMDPVLGGAVSTDRRVADLVGRGWCLYPPVATTLDPAGEPRVAPSEAADYATVHEDRSTPELLVVALDTLWTIEVAESCPVLVLPWTGTLDGHVASRLVTAEDGAVELDVPIATDEAITVEEETPILQVVPIPEPLLDAPSEAGVPSDPARLGWR